MASYSARVLALRRRKFGEADYVVHFLGRGIGKIEAIAKGTRRPTSKLAAGIQPFVVADVHLAQGRNLDILTQVRVVEPFRELREELSLMAYASCFAEAVDRTAQKAQPADLIFDLTVSCLRLLAAGVPGLRVTNYFELHFLRLLGFEVQLDTCARCERQLDAGNAAWHTPSGGFVCTSCCEEVLSGCPVASAVWSYLRALRVTRPGALGAISADAATEDEVCRLLMEFAHYHLGFNLKSADFLRTVEGLGGAQG